MRDIAILAPTRGRRESARRLIDAVAGTARLRTDLILAVDDDDRSYDGLLTRADHHVRLITGPRQPCWAWTNDLARNFAAEYRAVASLGDDHEPQTPGWDHLLLDALAGLPGGIGIAYGDDTLQGRNLPTAPVMSSAIPATTGWMFLPGLRYFADNAWKALGEAAGCLAWVPQVTIRHYHYTFGTAPFDATYAEAEPGWARDQAAYENWRQHGLARDAEKILALVKTP